MFGLSTKQLAIIAVVAYLAYRYGKTGSFKPF